MKRCRPREGQDSAGAAAVGEQRSVLVTAAEESQAIVAMYPMQSPQIKVFNMTY